MLRTFRDKRTERLLRGERIVRLDVNLQRQAREKLLTLNAADSLNDLRSPPGNRLEALAGDRNGQHSIRVNDPWPIYFRWRGKEAFEVAFCDYHD